MDQSPLVNLTAMQKIAIAHCNNAIGIDYSEAGFPESNPADRAVYEHFKNSGELDVTTLGAFGATRRASLSADQDPGLRALLECGAPALILVGKSSRQQAEVVLNVSASQNLDMVGDTFAFLKSETRNDLTFDAEHYYDGFKLDRDYSLEVLRKAIENGANRVVLCDTNGGSFPNEIARITEETIQSLDLKGVTIGVHMHNDGDLATANTLAGVDAGARHVQGTWFGLGERVGNADLFTVIPNLHRSGYVTNVDSKKLTPVADKISQILQIRMPRNKPFVGPDAFVHKAGQHVRGNSRDPMANQFMDAALVGNKARSILSKQAGAGNIDDFLQRCAILDEETRSILSRTENMMHMLDILKREESKGITYRDAEASFLILVLREMNMFQSHFEILEYSFVDTSNTVSETTLKLRIDDNPEGDEYVGTSQKGVVDALKQTFDIALLERFPALQDLHLIDYEVHKLPRDEGTASEVQVVIEFTDDSGRFCTTGVGADILAASGNALSDAIHYRILKNDLSSVNPH